MRNLYALVVKPKLWFCVEQKLVVKQLKDQCKAEKIKAISVNMLIRGTLKRYKKA